MCVITVDLTTTAWELMIKFTKFIILNMIDAERIGELGDDPNPLS